MEQKLASFHHLPALHHHNQHHQPPPAAPLPFNGAGGKESPPPAEPTSRTPPPATKRRAMAPTVKTEKGGDRDGEAAEAEHCSEAEEVKPSRRQQAIAVGTAPTMPGFGVCHNWVFAGQFGQFFPKWHLIV